MFKRFTIIHWRAWGGIPIQFYHDVISNNRHHPIVVRMQSIPKNSKYSSNLSANLPFMHIMDDLDESVINGFLWSCTSYYESI